MVCGFSRLILPPDFSPALWCGGRAMRVKGQRSCEGGVSFWGNESPWTWDKNDSLGLHAGRGREGTPLFSKLPAGAGRGGGAMNREERGVGTEEYKGEQDASLGLVFVVVRWLLLFSSW